MKIFTKLFFIAVLMLSIDSDLWAQIKGITESGDEVILYDDGTWLYAADSSTRLTAAIPLNDTSFTRSKKASFLVKSKKIDVGIYINPKEWKFTKAEPTEPAEFKFEKIDGDLFAMLITEKIGIPIESLSQIAFDNAKNAAPDARLIAQEYRVVNGTKVVMMKITGTIQGIKFVYFGYYYSDENGSVQFLTYTSANLFETYKKDMETLLNGFVLLDN